jgi:hypothetical protein
MSDKLPEEDSAKSAYHHVALHYLSQYLSLAFLWTQYTADVTACLLKVW